MVDIKLHIHVQYIKSQINKMEKPKTEKPVEKANQNSTSPQHPEKKERKKHEDKKIKHQRPAEFQRNADLITEETVLDPLPKKNQVLLRPNLKDYQERQAKNKEKVSKLIEKKKQLFKEKFKATKPLVKGEGGAHQDFQIEIEEFNQIKQRFNEAKNQRNQKRDLLTKLIEEAKTNNANLKKFKQASKNSRQYLEDQIERLEHKLTASQISKDQEKTLNSQIMTMKRKIKECEPAGNIQVRIDKAEQRKEELDAEIDKLKEQKEPLEQQCKQLKQQLDSKNEHINKLKGTIKTQNAQKSQAKERNDKQYEEWKVSKQKRIDEANEKIKQIDQLNKKIWEQYHSKNDLYWEQKHKLDFLEWQHRVKEAKIRDKQREKRKAAAIQKEKQREKQDQLQKYIKEIELCNFLANYLKDLTSQNKETKQEKKTQQTKDVKAAIGQDSQWKKQKGLVVLQSKKSKQDEEPAAKKGKKNKKKGQKGQQETTAKKFQIPFNISLLFEQLKLLAPESLEEVDKKIAELREREKLFQRACGEEVNEADKLEIEKIKGNEKKGKKEKGGKQGKKQEQEFPTL